METDLLPEGKKYHILRFVDELHKHVHQAIWEAQNEK